MEILAGKLRAAIPERRKGKRALRAVVQIADRLTRPDDLAPRLAHNARRDPEPEVRLQNLLTLIREYPSHPATREALRAASKDDSDEIRLRAGIGLGDEGRDVLLRLASGGELASGSTADDSCSARAVVALGERLPRARAEALLGDALLGRRPLTAWACVQVLGRMGGAAAVAPLAKVLLTERGAVAAEAARALGATGVAAAERPLLDALERGLPELRVPVVEAMGRVGSVGAVPHLKAAEARHPDDKDLRQATRQAIAAIQSRLTGASPGQLSLAEGEAGQLSLAENEAGRLSLAEGEAGRLSLAPEDERRRLSPKGEGAG